MEGRCTTAQLQISRHLATHVAQDLAFLLENLTSATPSSSPPPIHTRKITINMFKLLKRR
jgi:hypothetical protein